jgi:hypothetical protein
MVLLRDSVAAKALVPFFLYCKPLCYSKAVKRTPSHKSLRGLSAGKPEYDLNHCGALQAPLLSAYKAPQPVDRSKNPLSGFLCRLRLKRRRMENKV